MSDTPDLDKARKAAKRVLDKTLFDDEHPQTFEDVAHLILIKQAEEAERCARFPQEKYYPGQVFHSANSRNRVCSLLLY